MRSQFLKKINFLVVATAILFLAGCAGSSTKKVNEQTPVVQKAQQKEPLVIGNETKLLLKDLAENGDYVNGRNFPSLIKASSVFDELGNNNLIVDIRSKEEFTSGHIQGAINKDFSSLPEYFVSGIKPFEYKRIIIVSSDGQVASYTASLLRLMGYGNVYALRWGMSGWNTSSAQKGWLAGCSSDFQDQLEETINNKPIAKEMPQLKTDKTSGEEIGTARFQQLFSEDLSKVMVNSSDVFADPSAYYVMNYDRRDKYESGHIPGAVRYKPNATLSFVDEMATLPIDKTIVVYCGTGHNSGFVTAYLRLFGYDARTLSYGNNSFMFDKMVADQATLSWLPFTSEDIANYKTVK